MTRNPLSHAARRWWRDNKPVCLTNQLPLELQRICSTSIKSHLLGKFQLLCCEFCTKRSILILASYIFLARTVQNDHELLGSFNCFETTCEVSKKKLNIKNVCIVHRLMFIAFVFFFVKCASGNFQILEGVNSKFCSWRTMCWEAWYGDACRQILKRDQPCRG